jgi:Tfp pilus assembly protein PilP
MAQKELHLENQRGEPLDTHNRNVYGYDQGNRREPFNSLLGPLTQDIPSPRLSGSPEKNKEHWRLLGIVAGKNGYRAMIESSETNRHIVAPGKRVGTKGWKVKQIKEDRLILEKPPESRSGQTKGLSILTLTFPD